MGRDGEEGHSRRAEQHELKQELAGEQFDLNGPPSSTQVWSNSHQLSAVPGRYDCHVLTHLTLTMPP